MVKSIHVVASAFLFLICFSHSSAFLVPSIFPLSCLTTARNTRSGPLSLRAASGDLFQRLGGHGALDSCVEEFYDRLMEDSDLADFLDGVDDVALKENENNLVRAVFRGIPDGKKVADLSTGLGDAQFDTVMQHMQETFEFICVDDAIAKEAMGVLKPMRGLFAGK